MSSLRSRPSRLRALVTAGLALSVLTAGCARDGRELAEPRSDQTTTTRPPPPTSALPEVEGLNGLKVWSSDFAAGDPAPLDATCEGANQPPDIGWEGIPEGTSELALALIDQTDPNAPLLLWLVAGIPPSAAGLVDGVLPDDAVATLNDYGQVGWGNPCFETLNQGTRDLQFRLYVIASPTGIQTGAAGNEAWDIVAASANDSASYLMRLETNP